VAPGTSSAAALTMIPWRRMSGSAWDTKRARNDCDSCRGESGWDIGLLLGLWELVVLCFVGVLWRNGFALSEAGYALQVSIHRAEFAVPEIPVRVVRSLDSCVFRRGRMVGVTTTFMIPQMPFIPISSTVPQGPWWGRGIHQPSPSLRRTVPVLLQEACPPNFRLKNPAAYT
jgi:hypothetical protein